MGGCRFRDWKGPVIRRFESRTASLNVHFGRTEWLGGLKPQAILYTGV